MSSLANSGSGKIDVDALLGLLEDAEKLDMAKTYQAQQIEKLQFHLVQTGLCGRAVIVPGERDIDDLLSAFPIQPSSVPSLSINGRKYLEDTHLSTAAQIQTEQEAIPPVRRICAQTWPSTPGPTLQTYNVRPASSSLGRIPAPDFLVSGQWIIVEELDKTSEGRELTILEKPSTTLSQYARGKTGAVKPFAPGGVDLEPNSSDILGSKSGFQKTDQETSYLTLEAIEKSLVVLGEWTDDDLISAPPGLHRGLTRADFEPKVEVNMEPSNEQGISTESVVGLVEKIERKREVAPISRPLAGKLDLAAIFQGSDTSSDAYTSSEDESEAEPTETTELSPPEMVPDLGSLNIPFVETLEGIEEDEERLLDTLLGIPTGEAGGTISLKHREMISHLLHKGREENRESWAITSLLDVSDFRSLVPNPAIEYPFELDGFQKQAVARLERRECVFVAAHTSAGKTVVAEYAIALAAAHMTRAIYTSPIKALSNQKYRDFKKRFGEDVGLITGDVSINPEASCLIMTTEILRSMLYRGADLVRDIEWVIFDEVHYINDTERGVVWEEVIIMLPEHAGMIFLSATTPNTIEFSDWIGRTKKKPVHVITTDYRPVPLQHFIYAGNEMHKVMDHHKTFLPAGHAAAAAILAPKEEKKTTPSQPGGRGRGTADSTRGGARGGGRAPVQKFGARSENRHDSMGKKSQWQALASRLVKDGLTPTVIFSFSKKKCEDCADALSSGDYTDAVEKSMVHTVCMSTINRLDPDDARLPQVKRIQQMLKRGVGVHHGGLLPILKETVEILFSRGAVKFLFATETFAMGVNMPARTVVFNGFRKHDGREFRDLLPGEYTQMAGRAGRRGLDKIGTVLLTAWSEPPQLPSLRTMLTGSATKLESQFRLKYNMILNLLRVEVMSVEGMIKRSFSEFATQRALGAHNLPKFLQRAESALAKLDKKAEVESNGNASASVVAEYLKYSEEACAIQASMLTYAFMNARGGKSLLGPGRLLVVTTRKFVNAPAMVLRPPLGGGEAPPPSLGGTPKLDFNTDIGSILVLVLCPEGFIIPEKEKSNLNIENVDEISGGGFSKMKKRLDPFADLTWKSGGSSLGKEPLLKAGEYGLGGGRAYMIVELDLHGIVSVGKKRASVDIDVLLYKAEKNVVDSAIKALVEVDRTLLGQGISGEFSDLDIVRELKITEMEMVELANQFRTLTTMKSSLNCEAIPNFRDKYLMEAKRSRLWSKIQQVKAATSNERLQLFPDFQQRLGVLHALGYVDEVGDTVQLKGRVACEVNTADELIVTEIVFENVLQHLDPPEIAGILSALVFQEKSDNEPPLTPRLQEARVKVDRIARSLGALQASHGLPTGPEDFAVKNLNFGVVDVVYDWARGVPFAEICEITLVQEGTIVRTITRLDELLREVRNAARVVGDPTLYRKMEATSQLIRRGVIFCASLYV